MSDIIHLLPESIANQIAAGEVIQRPASVVKELVENAVDAGASEVQVVIKDAGKTLIQVIDNGKGMSETDARMAFERHATSKISKADDLFALTTMGFRGEALASIAAVAHVELKSRQEASELGTHLIISGSAVESQEPIACAVGSNFSIKNLFFNVPARRKFLKSNETEFRNIITEFERIALVYPEVSFLLIHNDGEIYNLPSSGLKQRILNIFGKNVNQQLLPVEVKTSLINISGFVGKPDFVKKRGAHQFFFVNNRFMKHPYFHKAVMNAYEHIISTGEMPNYFIYFDLDPSSIDVNIHPTKTEIKFENEQPIWQILSSAVKESLGKSNAVPSINFDVDDSIDIPVFHSDQQNPFTTPNVEIDKGYNPFNASSNFSRPEFDWEKLYEGFEKGRSTEEIGLPHEENFEMEETSFESKVSNVLESQDLLELPSKANDLPSKMSAGKSSSFRPTTGFDTFSPTSQFNQWDSQETFQSSITVSASKSEGAVEVVSKGTPEQQLFPSIPTVFYIQYKHKYIITSVKSGLMIVDQHRAHVRILFDQYLTCLKSKKAASQKLLFPEMISFTAGESAVLPTILDDLYFMGFDLAHLGNNTYSINGVPVGLDKANPIELLKSALYDVLETGLSAHDKITETLALSFARSAAIQSGKSLTTEEMDNLIANLFSSSSPNIGPDGSIIVSMIEDDEFAKRFK